MAESIQIGEPFDDYLGIVDSQHTAPRQRVKVTIAGNQAANQTGAPTVTTLLKGSCLGIVTVTGKAVLVNSSATDGSQTLAKVLRDCVKTASGVDFKRGKQKSGTF